MPDELRDDKGAIGAGFVALEIPLSLIRASELVALINVAPIGLRWFAGRN